DIQSAELLLHGHEELHPVERVAAVAVEKLSEGGVWQDLLRVDPQEFRKPSSQSQERAHLFCTGMYRRHRMERATRLWSVPPSILSILCLPVKHVSEPATPRARRAGPRQRGRRAAGRRGGRCG